VERRRRGEYLSPPKRVLSPDAHTEVRRATMDTFTELRQLADDLTELGDTATATIVRQAIDRFMAWKFEAAERLLERALEERRKHEHEQPRSLYFNTCVLAIT